MAKHESDDTTGHSDSMTAPGTGCQAFPRAGESDRALTEGAIKLAGLPNRLERYGVALERMTEQHLEMVRQWRTSPEIARFMVHQDPITPEMQRSWFASRDANRDLHFIIWHCGVPCGLSDIKAIDWTAKTFVGGLFMTPAYWATDVPLRVTFCASDFAYFHLELEASYCKVLKTNKRALRYNLSLGYQILHDDETGLAVEMRLERETYDRTTQRSRDFLCKLDQRFLRDEQADGRPRLEEVS